MRRIKITEGQLLKIAKMNEQVSAQVNAIGGQINSINNGTGINGQQNSNSETTTDDKGNSITKNNDGTSTITVNKTKANDVASIKNLAMKAGADPSKTTVVRSTEDGNPNTKNNAIPIAVNGNTFKNSSSTTKALYDYKKMFSNDPQSLTTATSLKQLEEGKVLNKKDIQESRKNFLLGKSFGMTKRTLNNMLGR